MPRLFVVAVLILAAASPTTAHDIPNARVDRSIQATLTPGRVRVAYEVSLAELTLVQDLRRLVGELPGADRRAWFEEYGRVAGPLNAKGLLASVDRVELEWKPSGSSLVIEGHPRYTFEFEAAIPDGGRLTLVDTNYPGGEGTSRLAIRGSGGVAIRGDSMPADVDQIPIRPVWQLTDAEERRTRRLTIDYEPTSPAAVPVPAPVPAAPRPREMAPVGLSGLLDRAGGRALPALLIAAIALGAVHAIQPGHGKTLVAASSLGPGGGPWRGAILGLATATAHLASVASIAAILWATRSVRPAEIHLILARSAGFLIAAVGLWRLGRHLAGFGEHAEGEHASGRGARDLVSMAMAGGVVPCWDAVALVLVAEAIGRLGLGMLLLAAFSLGMAAVLVAVGAAASRLRGSLEGLGHRDRWARRFGVAGGLILALIGLAMLRE